MDIEKLIPKFTWRGKRPRIINAIFKEKNKVGGLTIHESYYRAIVIRTDGVSKRRDKPIKNGEPRNRPHK